MAKASASQTNGKNKAPAGKGRRVATLKEHIRVSQLPGEAPLTASKIDIAAAFLLEAAECRKEGESVVRLQSTTGNGRALHIAVISRDMPFIVDSIAQTIAAHGLAIDTLIHPVIPVRRDEEGQLCGLPERASIGEKLESMVYLETPRVDAKTRRALEHDLEVTLADVRAAVADWHRMREQMLGEADRLADPEGAALLRWLAGGMLTQLGHVTYTRDGRASQVMGICRKSTRDIVAKTTLDSAFAWFDANRGSVPLVIKANRLSRVHRRVPLDLFVLPVMKDGRVDALSIHAGVWTSAALNTPPEAIPVLRRQLSGIVEKLGFAEGGHDAKALIHALTVLPHDIVIGLTDADILRLSTAMIGLVDRPRPRMVIACAPLERHLFAFVWLPRDALSTTVRKQIQALLETASGASTLDWSVAVEGGNLATLRFMLDCRGTSHDVDEAALDRELQTMLRGWKDAVEAALAENEDPGRAAALADRYADDFPFTYRSSYPASEAARDIERLRALNAGEGAAELGRDTRLYRREGDREDRLRLKIYQHGGELHLSDAVPALENFGFHVLSEVPTQLAGGTNRIHDFELGLPAGEAAIALLEREGAIEYAIDAVLNGRAEDDVFNRLVTGAALSATEADWLRAFYRYLRQANIAFTIYSVVDALIAAPDVTRGLINLFRARHDPAFKSDRGKATQAAEGAIRAGLAQVSAINDDRILRLYWAVIGATLRTNAFAPAAEEALAFKLDSAQVPGLPKPLPWREIFVYSRRVEGIHLRAGPVARGGIRWSDRRDDFRTEVLGLMKAQRVKNAVIVPTGAKGGFYPKRLPDPRANRDAWYEEGRQSYCIFIRTLLSVTDNIVGDKVVHPQGVVIHDGEDPYFVVAADKGTAAFSDTANAIAESRDFWLDDAFASGGSHGYDHKAMGITARGAWISVQRHFSEMGVDVQKEPVRVAGCGDMSGDVFGNGMLLSKAIKLVAAFDHRHIFIDPDPDPAASWKERKRLFNLPRSSWADYNRDLISRGGGVFARTEKRIVLSNQAQTALGVEQAEFDPESLITSLLKSPVDLMWFGGIGTYIKASHETNGEVGDPANDGLRVDGRDIRAKVIGEGANLGVTQAGRIEFALKGAGGAGGRINTDFIDNSAGVDCSDNEVNIKIALASARRAGRLSQKRRDALLVAMTDEVAELVLEDNRLQALALSIAEAGGAQAVPAQARLIEALEASGDLDRMTEGLADNETLARRAVDGMGLTRPELAVLLSSAKLVLQAALEATDIANDDAALPVLLSDFPGQMRGPFAKVIAGHQLRNEIVATVVANRIVNRMGLIHPFELAEEEGTTLGQVGAAFVCACEVLQMEQIWAAIDSARMPELARLTLFEQAALALRGHMADLLRAGGVDLPPSQLIGEVAVHVGHLADNVDELLAEEARNHRDDIARQLVELGAPAKLATKVANLFATDGAIGLARLSRRSGVEVKDLARAFILLGETLGLDWAQSRAALMNPSDPWERLLVSGIARDFQQMRFDFLDRVGARRKTAPDPCALVEEWSRTRDAEVRRYREAISRAQGATPLTPAMLAQLASQARNLLQR